MIIRLVTEHDIPELSKWFADVTWDYAPVKGQIPEQGFLAEDNGKLIACAWLYTTGTAFGKIAYTCTNPDASNEDQTDGLKKIMETIKTAGLSAKRPVTQLEILTKSEAFAQVLKSVGFRVQSGFIKGVWVDKEALLNG
jgi:hypothetical protein